MKSLKILAIASIVFATPFLSAVPTFAADTGVTCADFAKMSEADQTAALATMEPADAKNSSGSAMMTKNSATTDATGSAASMVSAGQVVSACQAAGPTATVHDVLSTAGTAGAAATTSK